MPSSSDLAIHLFLQLAVILAACRAVGPLLRYCGQTQVIGDVVARVLLGPSFFGLIASRLRHWIFPTTLVLAVGDRTTSIAHPSWLILSTPGQPGLVLTMFSISLEFNIRLLSQHLKNAGLISLSGIVVPVIAGGALGYVLWGTPGLFGPTLLARQVGCFLRSPISCH